MACGLPILTDMNTTLRQRFAALATAIFLATVLPVGANAAEPAELAANALADLPVYDLRLIPIEGILIVRGKVRDAETFLIVERRLNEIGFDRIANLMRIVPLPNDAIIERAAERRLSIARGLTGAKLRVRADQGVVTIDGTVENDAQKNAAADLVRNIEGVREVRVIANRV